MNATSAQAQRLSSLFCNRVAVLPGHAFEHVYFEISRLIISEIDKMEGVRKNCQQYGILQPFATVQMVHFPLYHFATAGKMAISFSSNFTQDEKQPILRSSDVK